MENSKRYIVAEVKTIDEIKDLFANQELRNLTISIKGNITEFPEGIANLTKLEKLYIGGKSLKKLSADIGSLSKLKKLELFGTKIEELPEEFCNLSNLEHLEIHFAHLGQLPENFGKLSKLKTFINIAEAVHREQIPSLTGLPESFGNLHSLEKLILEETSFAYIPKVIFELPKLKVLSLAESLLKEIPTHINELNQIESLSFKGRRRGGPKLRSIPTELFDLKSLKHLNLSYQAIKKIPQDIINLNQLESILLKENPIENVPKLDLQLGVFAIQKFFGLKNDLETKVPLDLKAAEKKEIVAPYKDRFEAFQKPIKAKIRSIRNSYYPEDQDYHENVMQTIRDLLKFLRGTSHIVPRAQNMDDELRYITKIFNDFPEWTFVDYRLLEFITQNSWHYNEDDGFYSKFFLWMDRQVCKFKESETIFLDMIATIRKFVDLPDELIVKTLLDSQLKTIYIYNHFTVSSVGKYLLTQRDLVAKYHSLGYESGLSNVFKLFNQDGQWDEFVSELIQHPAGKHAPLEFLSSLQQKDPDTAKKLLTHFKDIPCNHCSSNLNLLNQ